MVKNFDSQDVEFTLKENGDVEWKFPDNQVNLSQSVGCKCIRITQDCSFIAQKWPLDNLYLAQERLPLFDCDTFEVLRERDGFTVVVLLR